MDTIIDNFVKDSADILKSIDNDWAYISKYFARYRTVNPDKSILMALDANSGKMLRFTLSSKNLRKINHLLDQIQPGKFVQINPYHKTYLNKLTVGSVWRIYIFPLKRNLRHLDSDFLVDLTRASDNDEVRLFESIALLNENIQWRGSLDKLKDDMINGSIGKVGEALESLDNAEKSNDPLNTLKEELRGLKWNPVEVSDHFKKGVLRDSLKLFLHTGRIISELFPEEQELINSYQNGSEETKLKILAQYEI